MKDKTVQMLLSVVLVCQFGSSVQACPECLCCNNGQHYCNSNKICIDGCIAGYFGEKCINKCPENCKTCKDANECTVCKPGYYTYKCNIKCGKGCANNTCKLLSGECTCKSPDFVKGKCDECYGLRYGDECNNTCPSNCGTCTSATECLWCKHTAFYGPYCQFSCSTGCKGKTCNHVDGRCTSGCNPGYTGEKCDKCSPGIYGQNCELNCPVNCFACLSATKCTVCKSGFYGDSCSNTCPSGCNGRCSLADGRCNECKPGFVGEFCDTCANGTYGDLCSNLCRNVDIKCQECVANKSRSYWNCTKCDSGFHPEMSSELNHMICTECPVNCKGNMCDASGSCKTGCIRGKWGDKCNNNCAVNCVECSQNEGTCFICTLDTYLKNCSQMCSNNCNSTDNERICTRDTGRCLHGCNSILKYGDYCEKQCSATCNNRSCDLKTGHCLAGCVIGYYGSFCNKTCAPTCYSNESKRTCDGVQGHCLYGCKDGFHGSSCDNNCSNLCVNATCNRLTAECLHGCIAGYEGSLCLQDKSIRRSEENKLVVTIAASACAGFAAVILLIVLAICFIKRKRRQSLSSSRKCEENEYVQDMQDIPEQNNTVESAVIYAQPYKPKQQAGDETGKLYGTAYDDDENISAIDNDCSVIKSAKANNKCFEANDTLHANKSNKPSSGNSDYAVVNKVKSAVKKTECIEELYDTTHDNKRNIHNLNSNNEYAVLGVRSDNAVGVGNTKGALAAEGHDLYDTTEGSKLQSMLQPSNDCAVFKGNNGDNHEAVEGNTLYDTKSREKKMKPINNDYELSSEDCE